MEGRERKGVGVGEDRGRKGRRKRTEGRMGIRRARRPDKNNGPRGIRIKIQPVHVKHVSRILVLQGAQRQ